MGKELDNRVASSVLIAGGLITFGTIFGTFLVFGSLERINDTLSQKSIVGDVITRDVIGSPEPDTFYKLNDGSKLYLSIDGRPVEDYFSRTIETQTSPYRGNQGERGSTPSFIPSSG